jgi:hypothetical protein
MLTITSCTFWLEGLQTEVDAWLVVLGFLPNAWVESQGRPGRCENTVFGQNFSTSRIYFSSFHTTTTTSTTTPRPAGEQLAKTLQARVFFP